jgi:hypothetical protein
MGILKKAYRILTGKFQEKTSFGRCSFFQEDNIKVDLIEIAWDGVNLTDMAQDKDRWRTLVV